MKLIVGLGNPGVEYARTRHNVGFMAVEALAKRWGVSLKKDRCTFSLKGKGLFFGRHILLAQPLTFMNLSGVALNALLRAHKIRSSDILIISDDIDLMFGRLKIKANGSAAGHRGLESVAKALGNNDFSRLRLGIGRPARGTDAADYVLSDFSSAERIQLKEIIGAACDCCELWVSGGITECMNRYNKREKQRTKHEEQSTRCT